MCFVSNSTCTAYAQGMYDLSVEKIRMMLDIGASDNDLRDAIADLNGIVNDARKSHPVGGCTS
jgi:hypothetical protein